MMRFTMSKNTFLLFVAISTLTVMFISCEQEEVTLLSNAPEIELVSISSDTIVEFEDLFEIVINYKDGDGDIGFEESNQNALFVRDIRLEEFDEFYIGPILPPGESAPIIGTFNIDFPSLFIFGSTDAELTRFEIKLVDRANNESNTLLTPEIVIVKP